MLRITVVEFSAEAVRLRVEGQIAGPWLEELRTTCDSHTGERRGKLQLELEDVFFADDAGVTYLKQLREQGVELFRINPFLTELFKNDSWPD